MKKNKQIFPAHMTKLVVDNIGFNRITAITSLPKSISKGEREHARLCANATRIKKRPITIGAYPPITKYHRRTRVYRAQP